MFSRRNQILYSIKNCYSKIIYLFLFLQKYFIIINWNLSFHVFHVRICAYLVLNLPPTHFSKCSTALSCTLEWSESTFPLFEEVPSKISEGSKRGALSLLHWLKANLPNRGPKQQGWNKCRWIWISNWIM